MSRVWLIAVLLVAVIAASAHASCSITQNCHVGSLDSNCHSIAFPHDAFKVRAWCVCASSVVAEHRVTLCVLALGVASDELFARRLRICVPTVQGQHVL